MKLFDIIIDNKKYEFVNSIHLNGKNYVAYTDNKNIYISEFVIEEDKVNFIEIDDKTFEQVKEAMSL
ncbi:MAG: DUF1292 domain-containing protein [Bacilli bacterium]|nr:DUF1292 domain-containing protein [Bacilli bacterium]